jgi:hypothetical protein
MPPKSKKNVVKEKEKKLEDKTFGLKNKNKSAKVQKYVQTVTEQAKAAGNRKEIMAAEKRKADLEGAKKAEAQRKLDMAGMFLF